MTSIDRPTALVAAATLAAGALGAAAFYYKGSTVPKSHIDVDVKTREKYEAWKAGPWFVRPEDVRGTAKVVELRVHPVKSCQGISMKEVSYGPFGIQYDRQWCVMDDRTHKIITGRDHATMFQIIPEIDRAAGVLRVSFPPEAECESFEVPLEPSAEALASWPLLDDANIFSDKGVQAYVVPAGAESLSSFLGRPVLLTMAGPKLRKAPPTGLNPVLAASIRFQDEIPLHIASAESVQAMAGLINEAAGVTSVDALDWRRFRANVLVEGAGIPFSEDIWREIALQPEIGSRNDASISVVGRMGRCVMPNINPDTSEIDRSAAAPLKVVINKRNFVALEGNNKGKGCFGVSCVPNGSGIIRVGDIINVKRWVEI